MWIGPFTFIHIHVPHLVVKEGQSSLVPQERLGAGNWTDPGPLEEQVVLFMDKPFHQPHFEKVMCMCGYVHISAVV